MKKFRWRGIKLFCVGATLVMAFFGILDQARRKASSSGPLPAHAGAPGEQTCVACHSSFPLNSGGGNFKITNLPKIYFPNQEIQIAVTLTDSHAQLYGFQMTAIDAEGRQAGDFVLPSQNPFPVQIIGGMVGSFPRSYIEHTANGITPTQANSRSWTFGWRAPGVRIGRVRFFAAGNAAEGGGDTRDDYVYATNEWVRAGAAAADFDGDGKSDVSVFRPSNGTWYFVNSGNNSFQAAQFGAAGDKALAADFDGDSKADFAVFRPSNGTWYVFQSADQTFHAVNFGQSGDVPLASDFGGDGKADFAVFRPSNGFWYIFDGVNFGFRAVQFGQAGDVPLAGDYDDDAKTDLTVFRCGLWFTLHSRDNSIAATQFGLPDDVSLTADFDGDGKTDRAVFRPSNGFWYLLNSTNGIGAIQFGSALDTPLAADYDGDGLTDVAVFRNGLWIIRRSSDGGLTYENFGLWSDNPVGER